MCSLLALPGMDLCVVCLGGEQPVCANGCGRGVVADGKLCLVCDKPVDGHVFPHRERQLPRPDVRPVVTPAWSFLDRPGG